MGLFFTSKIEKYQKGVMKPWIESSLIILDKDIIIENEQYKLATIWYFLGAVIKTCEISKKFKKNHYSILIFISREVGIPVLDFHRCYHSLCENEMNDIEKTILNDGYKSFTRFIGGEMVASTGLQAILVSHTDYRYRNN